MTKSSIGITAVVILILVVALVVVSSLVGVWNRLNRDYQAVQGSRSHYSAALNTCTEKIRGVWEITNQYMEHESETFQAVARARSGYEAAREAFEKAAAQGRSTEDLTRAGTEAVNAALAFRVQVEAYPQLRAVEASQENIRNMEVSVNEIKTALDDWIVTIRNYNTYRGSAWPSLAGELMKRFPPRIDYYEGAIKELHVEDLNPARQTEKQ